MNTPKMPGFQYFIGPLEFLTVTQLMQMSRCPRRFFYQVGCRLEPLAGIHQAMTFGEAIHASAPHAGHENNMTLATQKFLEVWKGSVEDEKRNSLTGLQILEYFNLSHASGRGAYELLKPPQELAIPGRVSDYEIPFCLVLPGLDLPLLGRIDGLCRHRMTGELYVLEYKTYSKGPYNYNLQEALETHIQGWLYVLAARTYGLQVRGVWYETIMVDSKTRQLTDKPVSLSEWNLAEALDWAVRWGRAVEQCERLKNFPTERTGCNSYSHYATSSFTCDFKSLCAVEDWTRLKGMYNVGKQHLPFEIPKGHDFSKMEKAVTVQKDRELEGGPSVPEIVEQPTGLLIKGKTY